MNILNNYIWYFNKIYDIYLAMLIIWWIGFILDCLYSIFRYFNDIRDAKEQDNKYLLVG